VLLSYLYLHYVLDLWFTKAIKPKLRGEAYLVRYIDDFVVCFKHRQDAEQFQGMLSQRLSKFQLELEPTKTRHIAFGRFAVRDAVQQGRKKPDTLSFLGFTHYCARNRNGGLKVEGKTEKTRLRRTRAHLQDTMRKMRHPVALSLKAFSDVHLLSGLATLRDFVKPRLKISVREIRTLGSPRGSCFVSTVMLMMGVKSVSFEISNFFRRRMGRFFHYPDGPMTIGIHNFRLLVILNRASPHRHWRVLLSLEQKWYRWDEVPHNPS